jgi:hypothetical protein
VYVFNNLILTPFISKFFGSLINFSKESSISNVVDSTRTSLASLNTTLVKSVNLFIESQKVLAGLLENAKRLKLDLLVEIRDSLKSIDVKAGTNGTKLDALARLEAALGIVVKCETDQKSALDDIKANTEGIKTSTVTIIAKSDAQLVQLTAIAASTKKQADEASNRKNLVQRLQQAITNAVGNGE